MGVGFAAVSWFLVRMNRSIRRVFGSKIPQDVQIDTIRRVGELERLVESLGPRVELVERAAAISIQKIGFLRFNPFQDTGGDNSFVAALLDGEDNGIVISALYMREGTRLYAKQIERGTAKHLLSDEERRVVEEAITQNPF